MTYVYPPVSDKIPRMLHGADYNPEQWLRYPEILEEDIRLMKLAKCNVMSIGIFSWAMLEPEEGVFTFEWMDQVLDRFAANGIYAFLATPSGARPAWMAQKYPEVLRTEKNRVRNLFGFRHNHCPTSPVYREKTKIINSKLAERYAQHPAVIGWHISNEFGGDCHCELCQAEFRRFLQDKYGTLDELNHAWWTTFWSHTVTDWSQVESPAPHGETQVHAMNLDWRRFVTERTVDFVKHETAPLKAVNPNLPVTTNFMEFFEGLDYWKFADVLDFLSWDSYPTWHDADEESNQAAKIAMMHDIVRSIKGGQPFLLMESTPSLTNWQEVSKLKRPGMHLLASLQAVAHGSDSVQYFQWRKSRGSSEKLHGAVVDHVGHEHTRVFQDVTDVGSALERMDKIVGTSVPAEAAIIFDWENRWAVNDSQGPRNIGVKYEQTVQKHHEALWKLGVPTDVINMDADFSKYKLLIAPMLYMVREGVGERMEQFVKNGGTLVVTYWSGIVNETDLCFLGGFPGPLRQVLGIWSEELEGLHDRDRNVLKLNVQGRELGLSGEYEISEICDLIHLEGAKSLGEYGADFYAGRSALTVNTFGEGEAYYMAARVGGSFQDDFYAALVQRTGIAPTLNVQLPAGTSAHLRTDGESDFVFVQNYTPDEVAFPLDEQVYFDLESGLQVDVKLQLPPYGIRVLERRRG